ncbi:MAG: UbiA family prenyltransferase [Thermodesulfobacteriota bacterium]
MQAHSVTDVMGLRRIKLFMALSRTPHGLLDMATPAFSALMCLGAFPPPGVILLGLLTAMAGYTAVYALNDLVDYPRDKERLSRSTATEREGDLDAFLVRHPVAQGLLSFREGVVWTVGWALVALAGAYVLRPVCAAVFLGACVLEAVYCALLRVSQLRMLVSGMVKSSGGLAAVLAVEPNPDPLFVANLFAWLFLWEIGGQNVPNDWSDLNEDMEVKARTLPVELGSASASWVVMTSLCSTLLLSLGLYWSTKAHLNPIFQPLALLNGWSLLLRPAWRLFKERSLGAASVLFNRASYYPLGMLGSALVASIF